MPYACKFCIAAKGLNGSEISSLPKTFEEAAEHIEREHHYAVRRPGESQDMADHRLLTTRGHHPWTADYALALALGAPKAVAASLIEMTGATLEVNELSGGESP
jgi:hypothetical protein